jgi:hypothetical protein
MKRPQENRIADDELSLDLLAGARLATNGSKTAAAIRYFDSNSEEEKLARQALARRVRDFMPGLTGELLALAIDPDTPSKYTGMVPTRRVEFKNVGTGFPSQWRRDLIVIDFIRKQLNAMWPAGPIPIDDIPKRKLEAAYAAAEKEYNLRRSTLQAIWARHRATIENARR